MFFNEIVKQILSPVLESRGFKVTREYKGKVEFSSSRTLFSSSYLEVNFSYDYSFTKDHGFYICCRTKEETIKCLEDHEIYKLLNLKGNAYEVLSEEEQNMKYARSLRDLLLEKGDILLNKKAFMNL
ncbi:hypothetical protein ACFST9_22855 [Hymenobacter monticola]|uniref:DUF4304 domain-containing protein n=1 Tax=Hymenobacter monticola TaxID=1705399 RepID=A0ABY4BBM6_9BACT|nr:MULTISPECIES: hypothetical protein [Hymenobacter]UOE34060.1 hypothetical protein MTP16_00055 [Hymenobacter monticola]